MTVKGDLVAALVSKGMTWEEARETIRYILDCADCWDFATRFEKDTGSSASHYWQVIAFLKSTI